MIMEESKQLTKNNINIANEIIEITAKTLLSAIPIGGTLITSIWDSVKSNCAKKRLLEWQNLVETRLSKLEITLEEVGSNEQFTTAIYYATEMAIKTAEQKKMEYLANAVINSLLYDIDESVMMMFLEMVDKYTILHINILVYFQNPRRFVDLTNNTITLGSPKRFLYQVYKEMENNDSLVNKVVKDLYNDGLIGSADLNVTMTIDGMLAPRTTKLANQFVEFIVSNEGEK